MTDSAIVELLWRRDEAGLRETEARHGAPCRALAQNILGSGEDAEECWNDALLRAWNAIPPERPKHFRAYLLKLTRRLAIDRARARAAEKRGGASCRWCWTSFPSASPAEPARRTPPWPKPWARR